MIARSVERHHCTQVFHRFNLQDTFVFHYSVCLVESSTSSCNKSRVRTGTRTRTGTGDHLYIRERGRWAELMLVWAESENTTLDTFVWILVSSSVLRLSASFVLVLLRLPSVSPPHSLARSFLVPSVYPYSAPHLSVVDVAHRSAGRSLSLCTTYQAILAFSDP